MDLGCGGGLDVWLAARCAGSTGKFIGIDMTPEMIGRSCTVAAQAGAGNVEFYLAQINHPVPMPAVLPPVPLPNCYHCMTVWHR